MPDRRSHRGAGPEDARLFGVDAQSALCGAAADLSWLLGRAYAPNSALKLVGDRYGLTQRQRTAVARCACSDDAARQRASRRVVAEVVRGQPLWIDGYNVLVTVEAALAGGMLLAAHDDCLRDMASMHGTYRKVAETVPALQLVGQVCERLAPCECVWLLDRQVSNSGRLKRLMLDAATAANWTWRVELVADPDPILMAATDIVATADSMILDQCRAWFNLAREVVTQHVPTAWIVSFGRV